MAFNIPLDVGPSSSSGFDWNRVPDFLKTRMFGSGGTSPGGGGAGTGVGTGNIFEQQRKKLPEMFQSQLKPEMQRVLNRMAGRGIVNSSVTGSALGRAGADVSRDILGRQFESTTQEAGMLGDLTKLSGGFSKAQDTSAPYELLIKLLSM